jgi:hypothetical protein
VTPFVNLNSGIYLWASVFDTQVSGQRFCHDIHNVNASVFDAQDMVLSNDWHSVVVAVDMNGVGHDKTKAFK